jgi:cathepsin D
VQYHLHLTIGGPCGRLYNAGQTVEVLPDTGSSDLWVSGSNCSNCREETTKLQVDLSCSANQVGRRVSFGYRDGTFVSGGTFLDAVHLGDLQVQNQTVILVDTMGEADTHLKVDGILGLAPTSIMSDTFVAELFRAYPDLPRQFSFHLSRYMDQPSHLLFGDADLPRFSKEKDFQYSNSWNAERSNTWVASMSSIGWGGTDVFSAEASSAAGGLTALVDSGTSLIVLSGSIFDQLLPELNWRLGSCKHNDEQDIVECRCPPLNDLSKMPWLTMFIIDESGQSFPLSMSPDEYILEAADPKRPGERLCIPSFSRGQPSDTHPIILGMTFMRSFYTVFDVERMRIGFARSVESPLPAGIELHLQLQLKRGIWVIAFLMTLVSALLACYVVFDPDPKDHQSAISVAPKSDGVAARDVSLAEGAA